MSLQDEIKFAPSYPRRKRFPRITRAGYEAGHRENFVGKARPTGRTIHYAAIHPRRQADGVFWPLPIKIATEHSALDYRPHRLYLQQVVVADKCDLHDLSARL